MFCSTAISLLLLFTTACLASTRPQYGGTLRVETAGSPESIARSLVFESLTEITPSGDTSPSLAVRWATENQSQRWQFWLRSGVHFHDGADLSAEDVVRSLSSACSSECPWKTLRAIGNSIVLTTDSPAPTLPEQLAQSAFAISHKDSAGQLDGTGPFQITSRGNNTLLLTAADEAWSGRPFLDYIEIDGQRDQRAQLLDLSVGRADLIDVAPESVHQAQQLHLTLLTSQPVDLIALIVHSNSMQTAEQREAIADAVDRVSLWSVIFQKQGEVSGSILPNALTGYSFLFPTQRNLPRAIELASTVRATVTLTTRPTDPLMQLVAERLALNLHEAGLNVQVRPVNPDHADSVLMRFHLRAATPRAGLHQMLQQLDHDADDGPGDSGSLYRVERTFLAQHTIVPLLWIPRNYAVSSRVRGLQLGPDGTPLLANASVKTTP